MALIVDQPQRDLAGLVLTALELCRRGIVCHLVSASQRWREIWGLLPDFVLFYNLRKTQEGLARLLPQAGVAFGLLDTEGGVWRSVDDYTNLLMPRVVLQGAALVCAWSPLLANELVERGWFSSAQMVLTGCPRFDFYHPGWQSALDGDDGDSATSRPGQILVATNYSDVNSRFLSPESVHRELRDYCGLSEEAIAQRLRDQRCGIQATIELCKRLAADFPDCRIVLRPHPFEGTEIYRGALQSFAHVAISGTGSAQNQIFRSMAVIQRASTVGLEALVVGVPSFSPRWIPAAHPEIPVVNEVTIPVSGYEELRTALAAVRSGRFVVPECHMRAAEKVVRERFHRIDGDAHVRVAGVIAESVKNRRLLDARFGRRMLYGITGATEPWRRRFSRRVRYWLGKPPDWTFRRAPRLGDWSATDQYFDSGTVQGVVGRIRSAALGSGRSVPEVEVGAAKDWSEYLHGYKGHAVTLRLARTGSS